MTSLTNPKASKGQGLIEAVLILPVLMALIMLLFLAAYRALVYFYADAALHEAMICTDSESISSCEREFKTHIQKVLLNGEVPELRLNQRGSGKRYTLQGEVKIQNQIMIRKEMKFPLKGTL
ncbi:TadE family protein [Bdellovibrio sp. KM01]|uniref:TadE family protein n=1 Tax=Bdellovibrio sp. KM01 TaxID=2748865 RepID=UPI0015E9D4DF|nr:TadE family protein [Bdellovibrio sp. KM01]QLY24976.1 pilus assembly protein [Bdellovibrio sp. KM01]